MIKVILALMIFSHQKNANACATGPECESWGCTSFFAPEILEDAIDAPFYRATETFNGIVFKPQPSFERDNLAEWSTRFQGKVVEKNLADLIYSTSVEQIDAMIFNLKGKPVKVGEAVVAKLQTLKRATSREWAIKALYYIGFAKRVEPFVLKNVGHGDWGGENKAISPQDAEKMAKLIAGGEAQAGEVRDRFLEQRYRFQTLRLYYHRRDFAKAASYYEEHRDLFNSESRSIKYRAMEFAAGALFGLKKYASANFLFSIIFADYLPLKLEASLSFHPQEDKDWRETIAFAKSVKEKLGVYQLFGIKADGIEAIEKMFALDPTNALMGLLLVREVNIAEEKPEDAKFGAKNLIPVVKKIVDAGLTPKLYLWELALGHLYALSGEIPNALTHLQKAERLAPKDASIRNQIRVSRFYARMKGVEKSTPETETALAQDFEWAQKTGVSRYLNFVDWGKGYLSSKYEKLRGYVWALMLHDNPKSEAYLDDAKIDGLIRQIQKENKSPFENFLVANYPYTLDDLFELKAINQLYQGRYRAAHTFFNNVKNHSISLLGDPFDIHNIDNHDADHARGTNYDKATFALKMAELENESKGSGEQAARATARFANGLYNMSYYGNGRVIYATRNQNFGSSMVRNRSMRQAEKFYLRALGLSKDLEFRARMTFMAAKADLNQHYNETEKADDFAFQQSAKMFFSGYLQSLKQDYGKTKYYAEALSECGYLRAFDKKN